MALGVYVHIPFCRAKCYYCDFNSYAGMEDYVSLYCDAVKKEIDRTSVFDEVDTIYFGGGTPTVLSVEELISLYEKICEKFSVTTDCEVTIECNPATIDYNGFLRLRKAGFNRLSIGLQSTENEMLKYLGRIHTVEDFSSCLSAARRAGFENISLDLMYGLPNQTLLQWENTLKKAMTYETEHISAYALTIEDRTPFGTMNLDLPSEEIVRDMYDKMTEILKENGYARYEISNFAKKGYESRHNTGYWKRKDYVGFGAGAYSCLGGKRYGNIADLKLYCNEVAEGRSVRIDEVTLTKEDAMCEFCFLGLRMEQGIDCLKFKQIFDVEITDVFPKVIENHQKQGTLIMEGSILRIAEPWFFVSNSILADFVSISD